MFYRLYFFLCVCASLAAESSTVVRWLTSLLREMSALKIAWENVLSLVELCVGRKVIHKQELTFGLLIKAYTPTPKLHSVFLPLSGLSLTKYTHRHAQRARKWPARLPNKLMSHSFFSDISANLRKEAPQHSGSSSPSSCNVLVTHICRCRALL